MIGCLFLSTFVGMKKIEWTVEAPASLPDESFPKLNDWIERVANSHNRILGPIVYIFCNDDKILEVNRQFIDHDYYTDIITFDYSRGKMISGDIFISLDTVRSNSELLGCDFEDELHRVIIHGILHLCGIDDKGPGQRKIMEHNENEALAIL